MCQSWNNPGDTRAAYLSFLCNGKHVTPYLNNVLDI